MTEGTMLGHTISQQGFQVDPNKIAIIQMVQPTQKVRDSEIFFSENHMECHLSTRFEPTSVVHRQDKLKNQSG